VGSNLAIATALTLGAAFTLRLRQTEGIVRSLRGLMGEEPPAPAHTTLARRRRIVSIDMANSPRHGPMDIVLDSTGLKFHGPGEWARAKHGEKRRSWRKLHVSVDPDRGEIVAHARTDDAASDASQAGGLVARSGGRIRTVFAEGAYDGAPVYAAIRAARPVKSPPRIARRVKRPLDVSMILLAPAAAAIDPRRRRHPRGTPRWYRPRAPCRRDRRAWPHGLTGAPPLRQTGARRDRHRQAESQLRRSPPRPHVRAQCKEAAIHVRVANRQIATAKPVTVRVA
jgi:hypothetical protein